MPNPLVRFGIPLIEPHQLIEQHDRFHYVCGVGKHALAAHDAAISREATIRPRGILLVAGFEILHQRIGRVNRGAQILRVAGHFIEPKVSVAILADYVRLYEIFSVLAPACVARAAGVRRRIGHLGPGITLRRHPVIQFVINQAAKKFKCSAISSVGIEPLHEPLHHCPQIASRIRPVLIRKHLKCRPVKVVTAVEPG